MSKPASFVTVIVDRDEIKQSFVILEALTCHYSRFFRAAFNSTMIEGQTKTMRLLDVEVAVFGQFHHWLYTGQIEDEDKMERNQAPNEKSMNHRPYVIPDTILLAKVWSLAQRLLAPALQNHIVSLLQQLVWRKIKDSGVPSNPVNPGNPGNPRKRSLRYDSQAVAFALHIYGHSCYNDTPLKQLALDKIFVLAMHTTPAYTNSFHNKAMLALTSEIQVDLAMYLAKNCRELNEERPTDKVDRAVMPDANNYLVCETESNA